MTQPNSFPSKRKKIVGYILQFVGMLMGLAGAAWFSITPDVVKLLVAFVGFFVVNRHTTGGG